MTQHGSRETSYDCARGPADYAAGDRASHSTGGLFGEWDVRTRVDSFAMKAVYAICTCLG